MYSYWNCRGLWITLAYVREGRMVRREGAGSSPRRHQAGQLRHEHRSGVAAVAGLWPGGRSPSGCCGAFPPRVPALGQGAQPAPRPGPGWRERAAAAVENRPMAKRLHVFLKIANIKDFQRQCVVALASYRHWCWNRAGLCFLVRGKHTFSGHFHNLTPEELRFLIQHFTSLTYLLLRYSVSQAFSELKSQVNCSVSQ